MIPQDILNIVGQVGPLGVFFLILFKLWSDWDIRRKENKKYQDGEHPRDIVRKKIENIESLAYDIKAEAGECTKESAATRQLLTDYLVNQKRG